MRRDLNFVAMVVLTIAELVQPRFVEAQAGFIATLPFARDAGPAIYLPVRINGGAPGLWRLDSGASECIIDRSVAKSARLAARGGRDLHGAGKGTIRLDSIRTGVHLEIAGRAIASCEHFGAVDLSNATGDANHPLAGILGYELLARYVVRIDFVAHTLSLYDPGRYRYSGPGDTIQLHMIRRTPRVDARIRTAGRPEVVRRLIVDLGSDDAVDDSTVRRNPDKPGITVATTGLGKSYEAVIGTLDTVRIGPRLFTNVPGVASDVGIVGSGIWSRFVCIFDYAHDRLFLESP